MKTVKITNMMSGKSHETECHTEKQARSLFCEYCDNFNIPYEPETTEAGGIGYTHRVELIGGKTVNFEVL